MGAQKVAFLKDWLPPTVRVSQLHHRASPQRSLHPNASAVQANQSGSAFRMHRSSSTDASVSMTRIALIAHNRAALLLLRLSNNNYACEHILAPPHYNFTPLPSEPPP